MVEAAGATVPRWGRGRETRSDREGGSTTPAGGARHDNSPAIRAANPVVILYPGVGMFTFAKNKQNDMENPEIGHCYLYLPISL